MNKNDLFEALLLGIAAIAIIVASTILALPFYFIFFDDSKAEDYYQEGRQELSAIAEQVIVEEKGFNLYPLPEEITNCEISGLSSDNTSILELDWCKDGFRKITLKVTFSDQFLIINQNYITYGEGFEMAWSCGILTLGVLLLLIHFILNCKHKNQFES